MLFVGQRLHISHDHHLIRSWGIRHATRFDVDEVLYQHCVKKLLVGYLTRVPHLPEEHGPATTPTAQRITPRTGEDTLTVSLSRRDPIRPFDQPPERDHQPCEHLLHLLGLTRGMEPVITNTMEPFRQNMLYHPPDERQCRDLFLLTLLGLVIIVPIAHPLPVVAQDAPQGDRGTDDVFRQVVCQPLATRRDLALFQVGHETAGILAPQS